MREAAVRGEAGCVMGVSVLNLAVMACLIRRPAYSFSSFVQAWCITPRSGLRIAGLLVRFFDL